MKPFSYERAGGVAEVVDAISTNDRPTLIAGGTNLLDLMKERIALPSAVLDVSRLGWDAIEELPDGGLRLGALACNARTAAHPLVQTRYPLVTEAILAGASPQIRNKATNGGNLMQRTRCPYFYDTDTPCNKREPGSGCGALHGFQRLHAILGGSESCIATHPSDFCVALAALEAVVIVTGPEGERAIPFAEFHRLPGDEPQRDNTLRPDEMILAIDLPAEGFASHHAYLKIRDRRSYSFALVSVAAGVVLGPRGIENARLALGGVAHKPWRKPGAERLLIGAEPSEELFLAAADVLLADARGWGGNDFKIPLARRAIVRALSRCCELELQSS